MNCALTKGYSYLHDLRRVKGFFLFSEEMINSVERQKIKPILREQKMYPGHDAKNSEHV